MRDFGKTRGRRIPDRASELSWEKVGDEYVVIDARRDTVLALSGPAAAVWRASLTAGDSGLSDAMHKDTVAVLIEIGLLEPGGVSRRTVLKAGAAGGALAWAGIMSAPLPALADGESTGPIATGAYIYWTDEISNRISRANIDGTDVDLQFIQLSAYTYPIGLAADSTSLYWTNYSNGTSIGEGGTTIGRASLDGTSVNPSFISGASSPSGVAVDASNIFWTNSDPTDAPDDTIGRANLDGSDPNQSFLNLSYSSGLADDGTYLYWANFQEGYIGRVGIDGSGADPTFIAGASRPQGVAVSGGYIYWANFNSGTIGRANLDGSDVNQSFIAGGSNTTDVAVDTSYVYWTNSGNSTIGRANLDGSDANQSFITGLSDPQAIVVTVS